MKTKKKKHINSDKIKEKLSRSKITIFTSFARVGTKGLDVKNMRTLRKSLKSVDGEYVVEKKTVIDKALTASKKESKVFDYPGSIGIAYGYGDPFVTAKTVYQFAKSNSALKLYGAFFESSLLDEAGITELGMLPTKEVLLGRLVGMLIYPMRSLAVVLNEISKTLSTKL